MQQGFQELYSFIDRAVKNRKYTENTAYGRKAALRLFEAELNEEEVKSLTLFKERFGSIYEAVARKNRDSYTAGSLDTYRKRVQKVLSDYEEHGQSNEAMNRWSPSTRPMKSGDRANIANGDGAAKPKKSSAPKPKPSLKEHEIEIPGYSISQSHHIQLVLRPDFTFTAELPVDLSAAEAKRIQAVITAYANPEQ